jgi:acylphosphatase
VNEESVKSIYGWVAGRVQGVGYRASFAREAERSDLAGWVRNLPDGRVEFVVEGAPGAVDAQIAWARSGPRFARVDTLYFEETDEPAPEGFEIRY